MATERPTPDLPLTRRMVRPSAKAQRDLIPPSTGSERPRDQLAARTRRSSTDLHSFRNELVELDQSPQLGPDALRLVIAFASGNDASRLRDPEHLTQRIPWRADVGKDLVAERDVKRGVGKRQLVDVAFLKVDVLDTGHLGDGPGSWQDLRVQVDGCHTAVWDELG